MNWRHETWRKLYVREEGTFAQLPLFCRAIAAMLLKVTDSEGHIDLGPGRTLEEVVAYRLGATRGDRRLLGPMLLLLFEDKYLTQAGGRVSIRNFAKAQGRPIERDASTTEQRTDHDRSTMRPRQSNEKQPKTAQSNGSPSGSSVPYETFRLESEEGGQRPLIQDQSPVVMSMPFRDGTAYPLTEVMVAKLRADYPGLSDIVSNLRNCRVYLENNPTKRPHKARYMRQRIADWLKRDEQDEKATANGPVTRLGPRRRQDPDVNLQTLRDFQPKGSR